MLSAPRTDPSEPNSGTRLLPRVSDGEAHARPGMKDLRLREKLVGQFRHPRPHHVVLSGCADRAAGARERRRGSGTRPTPGCWSARRGRRSIRRRLARAISRFRELARAFARRSASLISRSFALMRSRRDFLLIWKSPRRDLSQMSTKPRNLKVSGLRSPRLSQFCAAKRPNSIRRVLSG